MFYPAEPGTLARDIRVMLAEQCPPPNTFSCSPPGGLVITVPVLVTDTDGQDLSVFWSVDGTVHTVPASDPLTAATRAFTNIFAPGTHRITFTVCDGLTKSTCQTTVTIQADPPPPVLTCPTSITVDCTSANGAVVTFAPTATDDCSGPPLVTSAPASGSTFPIGTTTVLCTATDLAGNSASCQFQVTVLGPREMLERLLALVDSKVALPQPLEATLNAAAGGGAERLATGLGGHDLRGLTTDPATGELYTLDLTDRRLLALGADGQVRGSFHASGIAFDDVRGRSAACRFRDCGHRAEPGCAVRAAVEAGEIAASRLESFHKLGAELRAAEIREDPLKRREERSRWRAIHRSLRQGPPKHRR